MEENSGTQAPTPQTAGQADPGARRLARSRRDRMVAGVAGGMGDYFGVDPLLFRIGFVAIAIAGAPGVLIYLACWLLLPEEGGSPRGEPPRSTLLRAIGMALAVVIVLGIGGGLLSGLLVALPLPVPFLSSNFLNFLNFLNFDLWFPELFGAAALIAVGFVLLYGVNSTGARRSGTGGPSVQQVSGTAALEKGATTSGALTTQSYVTPRVRRERSPLGWLGFGAALVLVSAILLLNKAGVTSLDAGDVSGVFLAALGAVVLIGAWWGRARWLVPVGLLFVPIALLLSMIDVPMRGSIGSHYLAATDQSDLSDIAMLAGDLSVDLTHYDFAADPTAEVDLTFVAGLVTVIVPDNVEVSASATLTGGDMNLFGERREGIELSGTETYGEGSKRGSVDVSIAGGFGQVVVFADMAPDDRSDTPRRRRDR